MAADYAHQRGELILVLLRGAFESVIQKILSPLRKDTARLLVPSRDGTNRHAHVLGERLVGHPQRPLQRAGAGACPRRDHHGVLSVSLRSLASCQVRSLNHTMW